jgi:hypothetical protein
MTQQVFSGNRPFHEIPYDFSVIAEVTKGRRPSRPSDDPSHIRGLNDNLWGLIESCWNHNPDSRPEAGQIVERLRSMPSLKVDERPVDVFNRPVASRAPISADDHPLSISPSTTHDSK